MRHHIVCVAVTWVSGGKGVWGGKGKICITQVIDSNSKGMMAKWDRPKDKTSATPGTSYMLQSSTTIIMLMTQAMHVSPAVHRCRHALYNNGGILDGTPGCWAYT
jgi:hypothetical protein